MKSDRAAGFLKLNNMKKETHGGVRPGAGRKSILGPTKSLAMRIPIADLDFLQQAGIENLSQFYIEAGRKAMKKLKKNS